MKKDKGLSESLEDYLEVILDLEKTNKVARAKDIAERLDIQRGSVTGALKALEKKGLVNYAPYSYITLTPKGSRIAREITRRHNGLKDFLLQVLQVCEQLRGVHHQLAVHALDLRLEAHGDRCDPVSEHVLDLQVTPRGIPARVAPVHAHRPLGLLKPEGQHAQADGRLPGAARGVRDAHRAGVHGRS